MADIGRVAYQVMWNRLISVVEEQAQALVRTAFSTSAREAGDLSAGVYNAAGDMLAQAVTGTPGHVNAMADAVRHFIREIGPENMHEGDVYVTNDPWLGTGHLHDITVVTPSFVDGRMVGFFGNPQQELPQVLVGLFGLACITVQNRVHDGGRDCRAIEGARAEVLEVKACLGIPLQRFLCIALPHIHQRQQIEGSQQGGL